MDLFTNLNETFAVYVGSNDIVIILDIIYSSLVVFSDGVICVNAEIVNICCLQSAHQSSLVSIKLSKSPL